MAKRLSKKRCSRCKRTLKAAAFCKNKRRPDGLSFYCRKCWSSYNRKYYKANRQTLINRVLAYRARPGVRARIKAYKHQYYLDHKDERKTK